MTDGVDPGTVHPGTVHPGTVHPGTVHPGTVHPGTRTWKRSFALRGPDALPLTVAPRR